MFRYSVNMIGVEAEVEAEVEVKVEVEAEIEVGDVVKSI